MIAESDPINYDKYTAKSRSLQQLKLGDTSLNLFGYLQPTVFKNMIVAKLRCEHVHLKSSHWFMINYPIIIDIFCDWISLNTFCQDLTS